MIKKEKEKKIPSEKIISRFLNLLLVTLSLVFLGLLAIMINFLVNLTYIKKTDTFTSEKVKESIRIVQISDLHCSYYGEDNETLIEDIRALEPDIIIMSGDILNSRDKSPETPMKLLKECPKIAPTYFVYGNNECRSTTGEKEGINHFGFTGETLPDRTWLKWGLEYIGINVLENEVDSITIGDTVIDIYGVLTSNPNYFKEYYWEEFLEYANQDDGHLKITVCHEPYFFEEFGIENFVGDVCLSGHTHGGEVRLPILGPVYERKHGLFAGKKYFVYGHYNLKDGDLIVSAGLINRDFLRIMNKPELNIIDIVAE